MDIFHNHPPPPPLTEVCGPAVGPTSAGDGQQPSGNGLSSWQQ